MTLTNLSPGKTYYFRAAAQNSYGTSYGGILNFTTQTSSYTPAVYYQTTSVSGNAINLISLTSSIDSGNLNNGQVTYTVNYKNDSNYSANNAKFRITFPAEVTFKNSSLVPFTFEGNNSLLYKLDKIGAHSEGNISVSFEINNSVSGSKSITFNADINYTLPGGGTESKITFANLEINGGSGLASLLSAMGTLLGNWFIDLLIGLAIGFGIYHFFIRKKTVDVLK
ncbi:MAG: Uncharacterized protein Athens071426_65 [Parcubacteria group bacterium Athens0714_26]|nr:MAG: Uncharacterized protein Athens071426_65 [Parcubacteria group bacterium Athens0714_26]